MTDSKMQWEIKIKYIPFVKIMNIFVEDRLIDSDFFLRKVFKTHRGLSTSLEKYITTKLLRSRIKDIFKNSGSSNSFRDNSPAFRGLLEILENNPNKVATILEALAKGIHDKTKNLNESIGVNTTFVNSTIPVTKLKKDDGNLMIINGKVYKLSISKPKDEKIIDYNKWIKEYSKSIRKNYEDQLKLKQAEFTQRLKEQENNFQTQLDQTTKSLSSSVMELLNSGWIIDKGFFKYTKDIKVDYIQSLDKLYELKGRAKARFYVKGLMIRELNGTLQDCWATKACHPNISDSEQYDGGPVNGLFNICPGNLSGVNILQALRDLPKNLRIANIDSSYSSGAENIAVNILRRKDNYKLREDIIWK